MSLHFFFQFFFLILLLSGQMMKTHSYWYGEGLKKYTKKQPSWFNKILYRRKQIYFYLMVMGGSENLKKTKPKKKNNLFQNHFFYFLFFIIFFLLYVFFSKIVRCCHRIVKSGYFNHLIMVAILYNSIVIAIEHYNMSEALQKFSHVSNIIMTVFFAVEMVKIK